MRKTILSLFFVAMGYAFYSLALWHLNDGFTLRNISSNCTDAPQWIKATESDVAIQTLLHQNFYYLGKGSQCFIFESEDKQIVLKFFRHSRYRTPWYSNYFMYPTFLRNIQNSKREVKQKKLEALYKSCQIAYEELKEETGLLYVHLNKTTHLKKIVTLYDKLKNSYQIPIDNYDFILQKHGEHIFPYLTRLIERGKTIEAQNALANLTLLLAKRLNKGIVDHDAVIHKNSGFCGNQALFLDIGEFAKEPCKDTELEIWQSTAELREWLYKKDPQLAGYLEATQNFPKRSFSCVQKFLFSPNAFSMSTLLSSF